MDLTATGNAFWQSGLVLITPLTLMLQPYVHNPVAARGCA